MKKTTCRIFVLFIPVLLFTFPVSLKAKTGTILKDSLVVSGYVTEREEVWDRRTNPMMGRPDILIELIYHIKVLSVMSGVAPRQDVIVARVKEQNMLIKLKGIPRGKNGIFTLKKDSLNFKLVNFKALPGSVNIPVKKDSTAIKKNETIQDKPESDSLVIMEKKGGKEMTKSKELQAIAVRLVAKKYGMKAAEFISLTSFSGPCPPDGGYVYWGVRGQIKKEWYVWQPWTKGVLSKGKDLEDPKRYQKCNSALTKIMTPGGPVTISELKTGDLIVSGNNKVVPILKVVKVRAQDHWICQTTFDDGSMILISPTHPLPDGRFFGELKTNDVVNAKRVVSNELIRYQEEYTWDILPDSPSGSYISEGIEIVSTVVRVKS